MRERGTSYRRNRTSQEGRLAPAVGQSGGKPLFLTCSNFWAIACSIGTLAVCVCFVLSRALPERPEVNKTPDTSLQAPATAALGKREGAILMVDPQTGHVKAAVNSKLALRSDPRTDVGETVREISVSKRDRTGRAELISIIGDRVRAINGWEFKLIVGRALGWNLLKSSRFNVFRSGSEFVFRGGGFGHGLGLCQEGSHVMAQRGQSFQQILAHYFPGTSVGEYRADAKTSLRSSHFRLIHPKGIDPREAEQLLSLLESSRSELLRRVSAAGIQPSFPNLEVVVNETTGDFVGRTGMPSWAAAATKDNRVELQPLKLLKQRRILETTVRHELVHVLINAIGGTQTPRWLTEGMAIYVAGEGRLLARQQPMSAASVDQALSGAKSAGEMQTAYAAAYNLVRQLIQSEGEQKVWKRIADRSYSVI